MVTALPELDRVRQSASQNIGPGEEDSNAPTWYGTNTRGSERDRTRRGKTWYNTMSRPRQENFELNGLQRHDERPRQSIGRICPRLRYIHNPQRDKGSRGQVTESFGWSGYLEISQAPTEARQKCVKVREESLRRGGQSR